MTDWVEFMIFQGSLVGTYRVVSVSIWRVETFVCSWFELPEKFKENDVSSEVLNFGIFQIVSASLSTKLQSFVIIGTIPALVQTV
jgi:hypothetical protein